MSNSGYFKKTLKEPGMRAELLQSCPTLLRSYGLYPPGSSVHGILQARTLELPCPPPGDLPDPGIGLVFLTWIGRQVLYH